MSTTSTKKEATVEVKEAIESREIDTNLLGKDEVFRILGLAESVGLPILLIGDPGTAKTATVIDYAKAASSDFHSEDVYMIEVDEGTMESAIKGTPDLEKLYAEKKFGLVSPITKAKVVIINEVDKARSGFRNCMLSTMNEKVLFLGSEKIPTPWKLYVATCNEIPKDEIKSPFWDRFILKFTSSRMTTGQMLDYYKKGDKKGHQGVKIDIPSKEAINAINLPDHLLKTFLTHCHKVCSDRTLTYVPNLIKAATIVYNTTQKQATIKVAEILVGREVALAMSKDLYTTEMKNVMNKVEMLNGITDHTQFLRQAESIIEMVNNYLGNKKMTEEEATEVARSMKDIGKKNKISDVIEFDFSDND